MAGEANPVKALFLAALEKKAAERLAFLEQACSDDALRRRVEDLLRASDEPDSLLDRPASPCADGLWTTPPLDADSSLPMRGAGGAAETCGCSAAAAETNAGGLA